MKNLLSNRRCIFLLATVLPLLSIACGTGHPPLYPAEGQIFFAKKPATGAVIWLHPIDDSGDPSVPKPFGVVDKDGNFSLSTYRSKDGAPAGKYRAVIFWYTKAKVGDQNGDNLLPLRYQNPLKSGLPIIEIKEEDNQLAPFQLTR